MGELHVDGQTDVASVPSDGGQAAQRFQRLVGLFLFHLEAVVVFLRFFRGFQDEHALVAVQDGGGVAFYSQKGLVKPHDGGDAHGAGENGCVGNGGTYFRGKTVNQAGIHGGRVGRGQVVGHQNLVFFRFFLVFRRFRAAEVVDDPLHDILHVRRFGAQVGVVHTAQNFHVVLHDHIKDVLHVLEALEQFRLNLLEDNFVLKEKDVASKMEASFSPDIWIMRSRSVLIWSAVVCSARWKRTSSASTSSGEISYATGSLEPLI